MDQIRLRSSHVTNHLIAAVKSLFQGEDYEEDTPLSLSLIAMQDTTDRCLVLATAVEKKFKENLETSAKALEYLVETKNDGGIVEKQKGKAKRKLEEALAQLYHTGDRFDKSYEKLAENTDRFGKIIREIGKIREAPTKGIKALEELLQQWAKLAMFFQRMSNIIEVSLDSSLKDFDLYAKFALKNYPVTDLKKDIIYQQAFETAKIALLVNMISGTYVEVSNRYILESVTCLRKAQKHQADTKISQNHVCQDAEEGIRTLVMAGKRELDMQEDKIMTAIKMTMDKTRQSPAPTEKKRVKRPWDDKV